MSHKLYLIFIFLLISGPLFSEMTPVVLHGKSDKYKAGLNLYILEDPTNNLSIHDITNPKWKSKFKKSSENIPNFGLSSSSFWVKFKIQNNSDHKKWNLIYKYFLQDHIELYFKKDGVWNYQKRGDLYPFNTRDIKSRFFIFDIFPNKETVYFLKIRGTTVQINIEIQSQIESFHEEVGNNFGYGILFGFIFIMFFYNLFIFMATKEISYLHYILYVLFLGMVLLTWTGFGFQFVFPNYPWLSNKGLGLFGALTNFFITTFTMSYLGIKRHENKALFNVFLGFLCTSFLVMTFSLFLQYSFSLYALIINSLLLLPTMLIINTIFYLKGFKPAKYYIIAFASMALGAMVTTLMVIGLFKANFFTANAALIGTCLEMILLSLGLAYKFDYQQQISLTKEKELSDLLEESRLGLERKVQEKTATLNQRNSDLHAEKAHVKMFLQSAQRQKMRMKHLLNNLEQGFLTINNEGTIQKGATRITGTLFETNLNEAETKGLKIWDLIYKKQADKNNLKKWVQMVFEGRLPFKDLNELAPKTFEGTKEKYIRLEFRPIYHKNSKAKIKNLILIASDKTNELILQKKLEEDKENVQFLQHALKNPVDFVDLIDDTYDILESYVDYLKNKDELFRLFHTLKARWGLFKVKSLVNLINTIETVIDDERMNQLNLEVYSLKVKLQEFLSDNQLIVQAANKFMVEEGNALEVSKIISMIEDTDSLKTLKEHIYQNYILTDIKEKFNRYKPIIDETAQKQGKSIGFEIKGDEVLIDYSRYSSLINASIHIFRNMVDHGIETEDERVEKEKSHKGTITVEFKDNGDSFIINLEDDGRGIDTKKIRKKLLKEGLLPQDDVRKLTTLELIEQIFLPGLSTKEEVTNISGRGVGMGSIKEEVERLGGDISIRSKEDEGTRFSIKIPFSKNDKKV
ncbi:MAG: hypothetical protein CME68_10210 [Halobacteriovoraceae bacterium]|nr:hypothetical protein [Halobacteriovoraceae bacterium]